MLSPSGGIIYMEIDIVTARNIEIAESLMYYDKTIALLRCGASEETAARLAELLRADGWFVYELSPEKFASNGGERIASVTIICDAQTFPEELSEPLERYLTRNGRVFIFGGPLFGNTDITRKTMILEGVSPLYKTFRQSDCDSFEVLDQVVSDANLDGHAPYVVCPNVRPDGAGFARDYRCRMLPLVAVNKAPGTELPENAIPRDGGRRGYAAFFILSDTIGHMVCTPGTRLGNVSPITHGSEAAVIGMSLETTLRLGGEKLISDMTKALCRGIFLFEAGSENYVVRPFEKISVGAKLISAARDFKKLLVRFSLNGQTLEKTVLAAGQNFSNVQGEFVGIPEGDYSLVTELFMDGKLIDRVTEELFVTNGCHSSDKEDFIRVENGNFRLNGKNWYMYGFNYFPLYQVSLELNDYWRGAFDRSNYIPSEVEKDLKHMKALGMNTVSIRIDSSSFEKLIDPLRDFFHRCARLGLKVMMSFCNITNPLYFDECAFEEFMRQLGVSDDPTLFAHDIFWESGGGFFSGFYSRRFSEEWCEWLLDSYGSFEAAEHSFGEPLDRTCQGDIICPPTDGYHRCDAKKRPKMTAFTRFIDDMVSSKWNRAITAMKRYDSNHLYTNRIGHLDDRIPNAFLSAAAKHLDFMCLEAYSITLDECGFYASAALDRAASYVSGGKPVTWVEYGISLPGMSGLAVGTKLLWDGENNRPLDWRLDEQRDYQAQFNKLFRFCDSKGTLPWFYPGGFRFTEHSDCGYVNPDGSERPAMLEYRKLGEWFKADSPDRGKTEYVTVDPDGELLNWCRIVFGDGTFSKFAFDRARLLNGKPLTDNRVPGIGIEAAKRTYERGGTFEFVTPGTGTTSSDTSLELCGGASPVSTSGIQIGAFKYLNGEFNFLTLSSENKKYKLTVADEPVLTIPAGKYRVEAGVGNLAAAKWLSGNSDGCVAVKAEFDGKTIGIMPLESDTGYLADGTARGELELERCGELKLRLTVLGRAEFGGSFKIKLI